ncbi:NACHT and WD repeat domain-containing protein 2-like isoform X2 [Mizuhopecten yessoensis]|uniref:NACHT and WD repeat domain-containing protein 2-like isoform X2 n=1 Tax=Mizuhopecten yessoensis TaxID=6573 RepID=UPI000B45A84A|nr:NACHT and WD repeat domain-containing protein 2-like isoform X2 [Mizuhopecten yessoensis]
MYRQYLAQLPCNMGSGGSKKPVKGAPNGGYSAPPGGGNVAGTTPDGKREMTEEEKAKRQKLLDDYKALEEKIKETMKLLTVREKTRVNMKRITDSEPISPILQGDISVDVPTTAKIVRIFTSSTFTDTMHERNVWMSEAYPRVKTFCQELGYEFQVVDMRWGVRDEAMDDHSTTDLCLRELQLCQKLSTGPNFVTLLSHKYGYRSLTREIDAEEFEKIFAVIESTEAKELLQKWYQKDSNGVPPMYLLSPISKHIPDFLSSDKDASRDAKSKWWQESDVMQEALESSAEQALGAEAAKKHIISVTEKEIQMGLLSLDQEKATKSCLWFNRVIKNIQKEKASYQLSRYMECLGPEKKVQKAQQLLADLKERQIADCLPQKNIISYSVSWTDKGINPEVTEHKKYLRKLSDDFVKAVTGMITASIKEREASSNTDPLFTECLQHIRFCQQKCATFHGRETTLDKIKTYLTTANQKPLVIHGMSGCGKTSIMAMAAKLVPSWMNNTEPVVVIRFLGTTPDSSNINSLLMSIIQQINIIYGYHIDVPEDLTDLMKELQFALRHAKPSRPLVLMLDSLDQLDPTNNARSLQWLPTVLNNSVKIVVSTLEDDVYECFPKLQQKLKNPSQFVPVPVLEKKDVNNILDSWLKSNKRTLTSEQRNTVTKSFDQCPIPLFLKLSFDEACKWNSFSPPDQTRLESTVRDSINMLYSRLEVRHGEIFVAHALGYLTTATSGLSESELEDILSCDDIVLNDVYVYWTPPMRRLPPLLLVRLRTDLQEYIVERGADGVRVMYWYHRQFIEAARSRYCGEKIIRHLHSGLAEFFSGTWSKGNKKSYTDRSGKPGLEDRHVAAQPMKYGNTYNVRKLNNLPFHRIMAGHLEEVKIECLANFHFLLAKLVATSVRNVVYDFQEAKKELPQDYTIEMLHDCVQLSQQALIYDPFQLASQFLIRLAGEQNPELVKFCLQCQKYPSPYLVPDKDILVKPGGQMVYMLQEHTAAVMGLDMTKDGKTIVTCADDDEQSVKLWNVEDGTLIKTFNKLGEIPDYVTFIANDTLMLVEYSKNLRAIQLTGEVAYTFNYSSGAYTAAGKDRSLVAVFKGKVGSVFDAYTGKKTEVTLLQKSRPMRDFASNNHNAIAGSEKYILLVDDSLYSVLVVNLEEGKMTDWVMIFEPPPPDDDEADDKNVDAVAITPDQKSFVVSNCMDNDLHFYNIETLQKIRVIKGNENDFCDTYRFAPDGNKLYFKQDTEIVVYDLNSEERKGILSHPSTVNGVICQSWKMLATIAEDTAVRIWDVTKPEKPQTESSSLGFKVMHFCLLPNPRYIILIVRKDKETNAGSLLVYDLATKKVIRRATMPDLPRTMKSLGDKELLMLNNNRKLKTINMLTMTVTHVFQGKVCKYCNALEIIKDGKEVLTMTRGQKGLKTYESKTGKTKAILYPPPDVRELPQRFDNSTLTVSKCNLCVCRIEDGPIAVFDLQKNVCVHVIKDKLLTADDKMFWAGFIPSDGSILALQTEQEVPNPKKKNDTVSVTCIAIYDLKKEEFTSRWLLDKEYFMKYHTQQNRIGLEVSVDNSMLLDDDRLVTSSDDFIIRVWNLKTGELIKRLEGHRVAAKLVSHDKSPYFLSLAEFVEENAIRVWDKKTLECVTSFRLDHTLADTIICGDGLSFVSTTRNPTADVVHWTLVNTKPASDLASKPVAFKPEESDLTLALEDDEEDEKEDTLDPDDDEDEKSDDDDDDDDNDDNVDVHDEGGKEEKDS